MEGDVSEGVGSRQNSDSPLSFPLRGSGMTKQPLSKCHTSCSTHGDPYDRQLGLGVSIRGSRGALSSTSPCIQVCSLLDEEEGGDIGLQRSIRHVWFHHSSHVKLLPSLKRGDIAFQSS